MRRPVLVSAVASVLVMLAVPAAAHPPTPDLRAFPVADVDRLSVDGVRGEVRDIAGVPGGGVLALVSRDRFAEDDAPQWVVRVGRDGRPRHVAGAPRLRGCLRGEWVPARRACLGRVTAIAALPGEVTLIATRTRIRRVDAGRIHTIAGSRYAGFSGDGGPAAAADLARVTDLLAMPDGAVAFADLRRIRRIAPDGTIATIAGDGSAPPESPLGTAPAAPPTVAALDARLGGFVTLALLPDWTIALGQSEPPVVARLTPEGMVAPLTASQNGVTDVAATADGIVYARSDGELVRVRGAGATRVGHELGPTAIAPAGGRALYVADRRGVQLLTPIPSRVLALALRADRTVAGARSLATAVTITRRAQISLQVLRGGRRVAGIRTQAEAGATRVWLHRAFRPGVYGVRVRARAGGHRVTRRLALVLGGRLPAGVARAVARDIVRAAVGRRGRVSRCRAFGARRVDCAVARRARQRRCATVLSVRLAASGQVRVGEYRCRGPFAAAPAWSEPPVAVGLEGLRP